MKIAIYLQDGPDGELKMRRMFLDHEPGDMANQAAGIAQEAVKSWMRENGHGCEVDKAFEVTKDYRDLSQSEKILRAFNGG